jgi:hypothetical protein
VQTQLLGDPLTIQAASGDEQTDRTVEVSLDRSAFFI